MRLKKYNEKRDFSKTDEPEGKVQKSSQKRFVIQFHRARRDHYDFRLEHNGVLVSWAIPKGLSENYKDKRLAVKVEENDVRGIHSAAEQLVLNHLHKAGLSRTPDARDDFYDLGVMIKPSHLFEILVTNIQFHMRTSLSGH